MYESTFILSDHVIYTLTVPINAINEMALNNHFTMKYASIDKSYL